MQRKDISDTYKWRLEDIFSNEDAWESEYQSVINTLPSLKEFQGLISRIPEKLHQCLVLQETLSLQLRRLGAYAGMRKDQDTRETKYQALADRVKSLYSQVANACSFITPEILTIDSDILEGFYLSNPSLLHYQKAINDILRDKNHVLSNEQEAILSQVGQLSSIPQSIFGMINDADMTYGTITDETGNEVELTKANYSLFMESADRSVRKQAFETLYASYIKQKNTIATTFHANVKKDVLFSKIRNYPSARERSLHEDDIPVSVYDNLIDTVKSNLHPMFQYLELRKELLDVEELHMYDMYASLAPDADEKITYEAAYDMMKKGLSVLGEEYISLLEKAYNEGWIDVYPNQGKRSGAYCWGTYGIHPFVLLNHKDNLNSAFTLAHEMGHALHSHYSHHALPYTYAHYTIFTAEVASTVNEVLMMHHLLQETTDDMKRLKLLNYFLEQFKSTLFRQTMFAEFERNTYEKAEKGIPLTVDVLNDIYLQLVKDYFGENVVLDEEIQYEWMRIPHFYNAFYVFKYATGFSAAIAIANRILKEGGDATNAYLRFLQTGGSDSPIELLKVAGVDMSSPAPIEDALSYFGELVNEFETLAKKLKKAKKSN